MEDAPNWQQIANHLYDELRVHGVTECVFNHKDFCGCDVQDCIVAYEEIETRFAQWDKPNG